MRWILVVILITMIIPGSEGNLRKDTLVDHEYIHDMVKQQLDLGPRIPGSPGAEAFIDWIQQQIPSPWNVQIQQFEYKNVSLSNLIVTQSESLPPILISAHWDSRAIADQDPNFFNRDKPVPGANDGASGVAGILELIKHMPAEDASKFGFLFFDAEDQGYDGIIDWDWIMGSSYFADSMTEEEVNATQALVLLDMIGDDELNIPYEKMSTDYLVDDIWAVAKNLGYDDIFLDEPGYSLIDDHIPFKSRGIPVIDIIDFQYPEWHTINDDLEHISSESIAIVVDVVLSWMKLNFFTYTTDTPTLPSSTISNAPFPSLPLFIAIIAILRYSRYAPIQWGQQKTT